MYKSLSRFMQRHGFRGVRASSTPRKTKRPEAFQIVKQQSSGRRAKPLKRKSRQPERLRIKGPLRVVCPFGCGYSALKLELLSHIKIVHERLSIPKQSPSGVPVNIFYTQLHHSDAFKISNRIRAAGGVAHAIQVEDDAVSRVNFGKMYCFKPSVGFRREAAKIINLISDVASLEIVDGKATSPAGVRYAIWLGGDSQNGRSPEPMRYGRKIQTMLSCPLCPAKVREDRLAGHVRRVHNTERQKTHPVDQRIRA
jgi:hypothetical protein